MTNHLINEPTMIADILQQQIDILKKQKKVFSMARDKETEPDKRKTLDDTIWHSQSLIDKLGNEKLKNIEIELKPLEPQLQEGLENLEKVQEDINNTVNIFKEAEKFTGVVKGIFGLF
ncbi:MAG: hypothetical protein V7L21_13195 [Nostoc sp.]|uniref:hypothetical protein n=1 Tax=unclassified Nostoc TaxID=2593658 RepID=UPI0025CF4BD5|nr:hypothetical protein [Nostoc sp. NMS9]MBN3940665.1 hypothetical protein [Nostoc sp. NMS9]